MAADDSLIDQRYRLVRELGRGAMGAVSLVLDTLEGDRPVALKRIEAPGAISREASLRFKEEFRAMAKLQHPNTLEVYDFGQLDARTQYLTMEVVEGVDLDARIRSGPLPLAEVYAVLLPLLQALGFIHSRHYVHRDIKSQNLRLKPDGTLKLMDFGLMTQLGTPVSGRVVTGTPGYLPPEVVRGGIVDASSDLYAVGCLAYELLTGRLPFVGKVADVVRAHAHEPVVPPRRLRPEVPPRLERIVLKLLEKDQARRYARAAEALADLSELAGLPVVRENLDQKKSYLSASVLVGREAELARLQAALVEARLGRTRALAVGAPAGVGKTRLLGEFVLQAKLDGFLVLEGRGHARSQGPFEALAPALKALYAASTPQERAAYGDVVCQAVARSVANFEAGGAARPAGAGPLAIPGTPAEEKAAVNQALLAWIAAVSARRPLLLWLDDMHACDARSVEAFWQLQRLIQGVPVLLLGGFRSDETPASSPVWELVADGICEPITLAAFSPEQANALIAAMLHPACLKPEFARQLYDATGGNAFFLIECLRCLIEEGSLTLRDGAWQFPDALPTSALPGSIEETVKRRLGLLDAPSRELARCAAVIGRRLALDMLTSVSGVEEAALFDRLENLLARQFLVRTEDGFAFPHERMRETLYADAEPASRAAWHAACGAWLERSHAQDPSAVLAELAHHYGRSAEAAKAFAYMRAAGDQAFSQGVTAEAIVHWAAADAALEDLAMPGKAVHQRELWWAIGSLGYELKPTLAIRALRRFLAAVREAEGPGVRRSAEGPEELSATERQELSPTNRQLLAAHAFLAAAHGFAGQPSEGLAVADAALKLYPFPGTPLHAALRMVRCANLYPAGRFDELIRHSEECAGVLFGRDLAGESALVLTSRVGALGYQGACALQGVRPDPAVIARARQAAEAMDAPNFMMLVEHFEALWHAWSGRLEPVDAYVESAIAMRRAQGAPTYHWVLYLRPYGLFQRGEYAEALALVTSALEQPQLDEAESVKLLLHALHGQLLTATGAYGEAARVLEAAERRAREDQMGLVRIRALLAQAELDRAQGSEAGRVTAEARLRAAHALCLHRDTRNPLHQAIAARLLATLALERGERAAARRWAEEALAIVVRPEQDNPLEEAHVRCVLGDVALALGDQAAAQLAYGEAGERYHAIGNSQGLHAVVGRLEALAAAKAQAAPGARELPLAKRWEAMRGLLLN